MVTNYFVSGAPHFSRFFLQKAETKTLKRAKDTDKFFLIFYTKQFAS